MKANSSSGNPTQCELTEIASCFGVNIQHGEPYRKVWRLETPDGPKCLKKSKLSPIDLWFIFQALEYLYHSSFPYTIRLKLSQWNEPFVHYKNDLYTMSDWIPSRELDFRLIADLKQACYFLANFHTHACGFESNIRCLERIGWCGWLKKLEDRIKQLQDFKRIAMLEKDISQFSRLYLRYFEFFYRQAILSYEALCKSSYLILAESASQERSFCHHDVSGRNLLRTPNGQIVLIDFDYCISDIRVHDIINLLLRNLKHQHWNIEIYWFILSHYQQVSTLQPEEFEVLNILLCWPQDFWQLGHQYYYERLPWPYERLVKKLEHKINSRFERERFLQELQK